MELQTIGIVGAGVMGSGLAHALAQTKHDVILIDVSDDILAQTMKIIRDNLRLYSLVNRDTSVDIEAAMRRIQPTTDYEQLASADFVIENATENWEIKRNIYACLDRVCSDDCVIAVNTSAIPITRLASLMSKPERVLGMHFMNPVPLKPLVEIIRAFHSSEETMGRAKTLLTQMDKQWETVNDSPGFITNRVMMLMVNEAILMLHEGVSDSPKSVDRLFTQCFGHKMGPLETADLIGLDTVLYSIDVIYDNLKDSKYRPCPLLQKMVDAGLHGRKSGRGFYTYQRN